MNSTCTECGHTQPVHFDWSHTKPTMEGWYWYLGVEFGQPIVLHVVADGQLKAMIPNKALRSISSMSGQWSQRIPAPL